MRSTAKQLQIASLILDYSEDFVGSQSLEKENYCFILGQSGIIVSVQNDISGLGCFNYKITQKIKVVVIVVEEEKKLLVVERAV